MQGLAGATRPPPHPLGLCRNARYPGDLQRPHLCPVSLSVPFPIQNTLRPDTEGKRGWPQGGGDSGAWEVGMGAG